MHAKPRTGRVRHSPTRTVILLDLVLLLADACKCRNRRPLVDEHGGSKRGNPMR